MLVGGRVTVRLGRGPGHRGALRRPPSPRGSDDRPADAPGSCWPTTTPMVRRGLRMVLEAEPDMAVVGEADDGAEAVKLALDTDADLVVLDVAIGNMTGLQAAAELKQRRPELRTLMLSMYDSEQYFFEALKAGASGYVLKSAADRDLVEAVRAAVRGEPFLYPAAVSALIRDYLDRASQGCPAPDAPARRRRHRPHRAALREWVREPLLGDPDRLRRRDRARTRGAPPARRRADAAGSGPGGRRDRPADGRGHDLGLRPVHARARRTRRHPRPPPTSLGPAAPGACRAVRAVVRDPGTERDRDLRQPVHARDPDGAARASSSTGWPRRSAPRPGVARSSGVS